MLESEMDRTGSLDVVGFHKKSGFYTRPRRLEVRRSQRCNKSVIAD
jgi:hypothetical protein